MKKYSITSAVLLSLFLAACAQPEPEPLVVAPEPTFDKYGNPVN